MTGMNLFAICQLDRLELKRVKEYDFQHAVYDYAESRGWKVFYIYKSAQKLAGGGYRGLGTPGWPDLTCVRGDRIVFIECKSERGKTTPEQDEWLKKLANVKGADCYVAKPRDAAELMEILM